MRNQDVVLAHSGLFCVVLLTFDRLVAQAALPSKKRKEAERKEARQNAEKLGATTSKTGPIGSSPALDAEVEKEKEKIKEERKKSGGSGFGFWGHKEKKGGHAGENDKEAKL